MSTPHSDCPTCKIKRRFRPLSSVLGYDFDNGPWPDEDYRVDGETAQVCVEALRRSLDAMKRSDPKLAKREVEYVLEQIA